MAIGDKIHGHGAHKGHVIATDHLNKRITIEVTDDELVPLFGEWVMLTYMDAVEVEPQDGPLPIKRTA